MGRKLLVSPILALLACLAGAQDVGLLLGLGGKEGRSHTVWIGQQGVAVFARRAGDGYWLWRDDGLWHVEDEGQLRTLNQGIVSITDPKGSAIGLLDQYKKPLKTNFVKYVSNNAIGVATQPNPNRTHIFGGTGDDPTGGTGYVCLNLSWSDLDRTMKVAQAFDQHMAQLFKDSAIEAIQGEGIVYRHRVPAENWTLEHEQGTWMLFGILYPENRGSDLDAGSFSVGEINDPGLGAHASRRPRWARIQTEYPDAIDFTTSPDGKLTVIVTPTDVFVHRSSGSSLGRRLRRVRVKSDRIVMTQWIEDKNVRKVAGEVAKIKS